MAKRRKLDRTTVCSYNNKNEFEWDIETTEKARAINRKSTLCFVAM